MRARERADAAAVGRALGAWFRQGAWFALVGEATKTSGVPLARAMGVLRRFPAEVNAATGLRSRALKLDDAGGRWPPRLAVVTTERRAA